MSWKGILICLHKWQASQIKSCLSEKVIRGEKFSHLPYRWMPKSQMPGFGGLDIFIYHIIELDCLLFIFP